MWHMPKYSGMKTIVESVNESEFDAMKLCAILSSKSQSCEARKPRLVCKEDTGAAWPEN